MEAHSSAGYQGGHGRRTQNTAGAGALGRKSHYLIGISLRIRCLAVTCVRSDVKPVAETMHVCR